MAEGQAEGAPLLGGGDPLSPSHCPLDTQPRPLGAPPVHTPPPWPPDDQAPPLWHPDRWGPGAAHLAPPTPPHTPKLVRSQSSMDSGCECDLGEAEATPPPPPAPHPHTHTHHDPAGFSPLSPSQPGGSGPPSPGPSTQAVPLAPTKTCLCDSVPPADPHAKVTFTFHDDDDDEYDTHGLCGGVSGGMNAIEIASLSESEPGETFKDHVLHHSAAFPRVPSYSKTGEAWMEHRVLSSSSSTASMPMCRICHHPQGDGLDTLISPCRCAGTMQFIHQGCLNKWLEVKRCKKAPVCELCNYQFHRHKKFRLNHWQLPSCSRADKILHSIFLVCLVIMAACATITIICFKQDRVPPKKVDDAELTNSEVVTLTCGVLFFVAFFVAMYVEVKARNTLYRLFTRFLYLNQTWHIAEYDRRRDSQIGHAPI